MILLFGLIFITTTSHSQIEYGIIVGMNSSRLTNKFHSTNGNYFNLSSLGISFGGFAEIELSEKLTFYPKLIFNQIGDRESNYENELYTDALDYKLDYISIPLNFKIFKKPYIVLGPQLSYLINVKKLSEDFGDLDSKFDFGGNIGIGYEFNRINLELLFYQGLINILEVDRGSNSGFSDQVFEIRNNYLNLSISYSILK